jgi:hypothetical protein
VDFAVHNLGQVHRRGIIAKIALEWIGHRLVLSLQI